MSSVNLNDLLENSTSYKYNVLFIGEGRSGKSSWIERCISGMFSDEYKPSIRITEKKFFFYTSKGLVMFNFLDCEGDIIPYTNSKIDAIIVMINIINPNFQYVIETFEKLIGFNNLENLPIVYCKNKFDLVDQRNYIFVDDGFIVTSAKTCFNMNKPLLTLAKKLLKDDKLTLTEFIPDVTTHNASIMIGFKIYKKFLPLILSRNPTIFSEWLKGNMEPIKVDFSVPFNHFNNIFTDAHFKLRIIETICGDEKVSIEEDTHYIIGYNIGYYANDVVNFYVSYEQISDIFRYIKEILNQTLRIQQGEEPYFHYEMYVVD
jgi:GTP-binding nuclear protein Ran